MAYDPTEWQNREVEKPRTYIMTDNGDGTITLTPSEGQVFAPGTPLDASNLNKMEQQIALNDENKVNRTGDTMTGPLIGTIINADTLQQGGINLDNKYQTKGSYQSTGQYVTWNADPNGVYITCGVSNGKTYRIYLTSAQPWDGDASDRHVWVQTDS
jgi:outer membrane protein assembly factor BamA